SITPLLVQNWCFIEVQGNIEADLAPHILDYLSSLVQVRVCVIRLQDNLSANRLGLPENRLGLVRIVLWPWFSPRRKPGTYRRIEPFGGLATTKKYHLLNGLMIDGVRRCQTELFVCERAFFCIEDDKRGCQRWHLPGLQLLGILLGKVGCLSI